MKYVGLYKDDQDIATKKNVDAKQDKITGAATTITDSDLTANRALIANGSGKVAVSDVTSTELGYLNGVTSSVQTQLNSKVPNTRKVNGKALSADITLTASDVGALPDTTIIPTVPDNLVSYDELVDVQATPAIDADTLGGHNAGYFATSAQMTNVSGDVNTLKTQMTTANQNITNINNSKVDKTGGTMTGALVAQNNVNYTTKQVRNIIISTGEPTGGSNGDIWIKYTP